MRVSLKDHAEGRLPLKALHLGKQQVFELLCVNEAVPAEQTRKAGLREASAEMMPSWQGQRGLAGGIPPFE